MKWLNQPPTWSHEGRTIRVHAAGQTDFWRKTHDGGIRDNGHFLFEPVDGDFSASVHVFGDYQDQYDQAGLMVRLDATCWLKCGVELKDDVAWASVVVTREFSDWSVIPLERSEPIQIQLRVIRHGSTIEVHYAPGEESLRLMRQAYLTDVPMLSVGPMVAAPKGDGFDVKFQDFQITSSE